MKLAKMNKKTKKELKISISKKISYFKFIKAVMSYKAQKKIKLLKIISYLGDISI